MEQDNRIDQYRNNLFECQERAVRLEAEEGTTEEQIKKRCEELRNHIIDSESINNRFRNPTLQKIFSAPPRFRKVHY